MPSLHVGYKKARIKQYYEEGQALRIETTINDTRAKSASQPIGVCSTSNASVTTASLAEPPSRAMQRSVTIGDQRAAAFHFAVKGT